MSKLLVLFGVFLLFTCALFGADKSDMEKLVHFKSAPIQPNEKLRNISQPIAAEIILPQACQYLAEHSPTDQAKKIKAFFGSSYHIYYPRSIFPSLRHAGIRNPKLSHPLFILFQNLRI